MNNVINFKNIINNANIRRQQMANALDELEESGDLSEEYIAYALKFMTNEQIKYTIYLIKLLLRADLNQNHQYNQIDIT